jgi:hypothetical protein
MILQGSDNNRFYQLMINLANSMTIKQDKFSETMVEIQSSSMTTRRHQGSSTPRIRTATELSLSRTDHRARPGWWQTLNAGTVRRRDSTSPIAPSFKHRSQTWACRTLCECRMSACQNEGQIYRHVSAGLTCCQHVSQHIDDMTRKYFGRGTANVGPTCHLLTFWQHVGNMLALVAGIFAAHSSLG